MKKQWIARRIAGAIVIALVAVTVFGFLVMLLWNALIPDLFHGPVVTFWQAVGIVILSHILLRGWGPWHNGAHWRHDRWKHRLEEKLSAMTPEEREKFKEEWRRRCGWSPEEHPLGTDSAEKSA
jgi:hypothetical protein